MGTSIAAGDLEFCLMYGEVCHEFYGPLPWEDVVETLQLRWDRVRGTTGLTWEEAEPHVRVGWDNAASGALH